MSLSSTQLGAARIVWLTEKSAMVNRPFRVGPTCVEGPLEYQTNHSGRASVPGEKRSRCEWRSTRADPEESIQAPQPRGAVGRSIELQSDEPSRSLFTASTGTPTRQACLTTLARFLAQPLLHRPYSYAMPQLSKDSASVVTELISSESRKISSGLVLLLYVMVDDPGPKTTVSTRSGILSRRWPRPSGPQTSAQCRRRRDRLVNRPLRERI
jgi:hypothetical protein